MCFYQEKSITSCKYSANNTQTQIKVDGWKTLTTNSNYNIQTDGKFVRINVFHASNATVPHTYEYNLPSNYYPVQNIGTVSGTIDANGDHYATIQATTAGKLQIKLVKNTYGTSVQAIYGLLIYPL